MDEDYRELDAIVNGGIVTAPEKHQHGAVLPSSPARAGRRRCWTAAPA